MSPPPPMPPVMPPPPPPRPSTINTNYTSVSIGTNTSTPATSPCLRTANQPTSQQVEAPTGSVVMRNSRNALRHSPSNRNSSGAAVMGAPSIQEELKCRLKERERGDLSENLKQLLSNNGTGGSGASRSPPVPKKPERNQPAGSRAGGMATLPTARSHDFAGNGGGGPHRPMGDVSISSASCQSKRMSWNMGPSLGGLPSDSSELQGTASLRALPKRTVKQGVSRHHSNASTMVSTAEEPSSHVVSKEEVLTNLMKLKTIVSSASSSSDVGHVCDLASTCQNDCLNYANEAATLSPAAKFRCREQCNGLLTCVDMLRRFLSPPSPLDEEARRLLEQLQSFVAELRHIIDK